MKITTELLKEKNACEDDIEIFQAEWPDGAEMTLENLLRIVELELDLDWFTENFLDESAQREYDEAIAPARRECDEAIASAHQKYDEAIAPAHQKYQEAIASAHQKYQEAIASAHQKYDEVTALAYRKYQEATASIIFELLKKT